MTPWYLFFTDPILRGPTWGTLFMSLAASLLGVLVFVRKRSLIGETLSHAAYPGVTLAVACVGAWSAEAFLPFAILVGAFGSSLLGIASVHFLEKKARVPQDAALCVVLALFFGGGVLIASWTQAAYAPFFRKIQAYLYGQTATLTDHYILWSGVFALLIILLLALFLEEIVMISFDGQFARSRGIAVTALETLFFVLVVFAIVLGIRSIGVVLMSALLIAPSVAARQFTHRFKSLLALAGVFGVGSGFLGTYLSVVLSEQGRFTYPLPTGPTIVLVVGTAALLSLLAAPKRGLLIRYLRVFLFRMVCLRENMLKTLWHKCHKGTSTFSLRELSHLYPLFKGVLYVFLRQFIRKGWVIQQGMDYCLTPQGIREGARIVRLHRLWEAYLVETLGMGAERVHVSAEEMEHILTPALERKLTTLLDNPRQDPHAQPIPSPEEIALDA